MNKSLVWCGILGGIIVFIWGMVSWMVLPWHMMTMNKFYNEEQVAHVIKQNASESGMYMLPCTHCGDSSASERQIRRGKEMMRNGPMVFSAVKLEGMDPTSVRPFIRGLIIDIIAAFFITWLLLQTKGLKYGKQVWFVTVIGLIAGILGLLPGWNWMGFSSSYTLLCILDLVIGWFLAGLLIAKLASHKR
jgi:hypothetical protein